MKLEDLKQLEKLLCELQEICQKNSYWNIDETIEIVSYMIFDEIYQQKIKSK